MKSFLLLVWFNIVVLLSCYSQSITLNGVVKDRITEMPIPGATVNLTGRQLSAITDANGLFSITYCNTLYSKNGPFQLCEGETYKLPNDSVVSTDGTYTNNIKAYTGCDSLITTTVIFNPVYEKTEYIEINSPETYTLPNNSVVSVSGTYTSKISTTKGCDSIVITDLTVNTLIGIETLKDPENSSPRYIPGQGIIFSNSKTGQFYLEIVSLTGRVVDKLSISHLESGIWCYSPKLPAKSFYVGHLIINGENMSIKFVNAGDYISGNEGAISMIGNINNQDIQSISKKSTSYINADAYKKGAFANGNLTSDLIQASANTEDSLSVMKDGYFYKIIPWVEKNNDNVTIFLLDTSASDGVNPGKWKGLTDQNQAFCMLTGVNGKEILSVSFDSFPGSGNNISLNGPFSIPGNGVVMIGDTLTFYFSDSLVVGYALNVKFNGAWLRPGNDASLSDLIVSSSALDPVFSAVTKRYSVSLAVGVNSLTVTPTSNDPNARIKVNGIRVLSGFSSNSINVINCNDSITIEVIAEDTITTNSYIIDIILPPYNLNGVIKDRITEMPIAGVLVKLINKDIITTTNADGIFNYNFTCKVSEVDTIAVVKDGYNNNAAIWNVKNIDSTNIFLLDASANDGVNPGKWKGLTDQNQAFYMLTGANGKEILSVSFDSFPASGSNITLNGPFSIPGNGVVMIGDTLTFYFSDSLVVGYALNVKFRGAWLRPGNDATLSDLIVSASALDPVFSAATKRYSVSLAVGVNWLTVTPTSNDPNASIKVNGNSVFSGFSSNSIYFYNCNDSIILDVTAEDGITCNSYFIDIILPPYNLKGVVKDKITGMPIAGASVKLINKDIITTTNADGLFNFNFTCKASAVDTILTIRDGYNNKSATWNVKNNDSITVFLLDASAFDGVQPGIWKGKTLGDASFTLTIDNTGKQISYGKFDNLPGFNNPYYLSCPVTIPENGVLLISNLVLYFSDSLVTGNSSITITTERWIPYYYPICHWEGYSYVCEYGRVETTNNYYSTTFKGGIGTDATLTGIKVSSGKLSPDFSPIDTIYLIEDIKSKNLIITPIAKNPSATIKVNGAIVFSNTTSNNFDLTNGNDSITIEVTALDGINRNLYIIIPKVSPLPLAATNVTLSSATLKGLINANGQSNSVLFEYGTTTSYGSIQEAIQSPLAGIKNSMVSADIAGLDDGQTYHFRVACVSEGDTTRGDDITFTTISTDLTGLIVSSGKLSPDFSSEISSYICEDICVQNLTITPVKKNPNASIKVNGYNVASNTPSNNIDLSTGLDTIKIEVTLDVYKKVYLIIPQVTLTKSASDVMFSSAVFNGIANANGQTTSVFFEYGTSISYGNTIDAIQSPLTGVDNIPVTTSINGLADGQTYHYRVVSASAVDTTFGGDITFTTLSTDLTSLIVSSGTLHPVFSPDITSYICEDVRVRYLNITPIAKDPKSSIWVNGDYGDYEKSENPSYSIDLSTWTDTIKIEVSPYYLFKQVYSILPIVTLTKAATNVSLDGAVLNGIGNAKGQTTSVFFEYGTTISYGNSIEAIQSPLTTVANIMVSADINGLSDGQEYHFRIVSVSAGDTILGGDLTFTTLSTDLTGLIVSSGTLSPEFSPKISSYICEDVSVQKLTITPIKKNPNASIKVNGYYVGSNTPSNSIDLSLSIDTIKIEVSIGIYKKEYLIVPKVIPLTLAVANVTFSSAILTGIINANSQSTSVFFEYGTTTSYGNSIEAIQNPLTGNANTVVNADLSAITPDQTYHFRLFSVSGSDTIYGEDLSFRTTPNPITDIDGNVYNIVNIGTQTWMAENLKTTKYNDGTDIPQVTDGTAWINLSTPGFCWYNNDSATYKATNGALYNWFVVDDASNGSKNVCPTEWHVPSDADWTTLTTYLGGQSVGGNKMKEIGTTHWPSPNAGATNESGFTALPCGVRSSSFSYAESYSGWWSSTQTNESTAWNRFLNVFYAGIAQRQEYFKSYGFSIRCLRN